MPLFQKSVINSIKQDESLIALRWANYQNYLTKIDFIKTVKEEKYQDGFLKDIFEACLGYTLDSTNPSDFNLEREKKNETDGKKADGVIYVNNEIIGIVELKDQKTKNLDAVESQAFNYHASHSNSKYIIISNFNELRFYIDKKTAYERFNLFTLTYDEFKKLHLLMSFESLKEDVPLKLKEKSASFEQTISKELYKDFSAFRTHLFENIVKNNYTVRPEPVEGYVYGSTSSPRTELDKQTLLRLTQKLCDRIIFILFAEDRSLLKPNTVKEIRSRHAADGFGDRSMYDYYKLYFNAINTGNDKLGIPKYNGGLFATDEMLDSLTIDDSYLDMEAQKLSDFDFESDISVNILGHIFEQSLTDLEEINASMNDTAFDKKKSKRKKDGVFYTPEYITRYIVENTLGKLCSDKKEELKIEPETVVVNPRKLTKAEQNYKETLIAYREWLTHLKILDPACGSGAFLNQALEFLIREHTLIRDLLLPYEDLMIGYEIEKSILEHNLYGVDINEDAVEIAKLSLWLRTAHKGRELTSLNDKIVCANSLLAMPFEEGSFDVVIGNPPYIRHEMIKEFKLALNEKYQVYTGMADLFVYFYELSYRLLKKNGLNGFICSNKFFRAKYGENLRKLILDNMSIKTIADFSGIKIFEDATVDSAITIFQKSLPEINTSFKVMDEKLENYLLMKQSDLTKSSFSFSNPVELLIKQKIENIGIPLKEWNVNIYRGIQTGNNDVFIIDEILKDKLINEDSKSIDLIKPIIQGRDISRYAYEHNNKYLLYITDDTEIDNYKSIYNYLLSNKDILDKKLEVQQGKMLWYSLYRSAKNHIHEFEKEKVVFTKASKEQSFTIDYKKSFLLNTSYILTGENIRFFCALLNSKFAKFVFNNFYEGGGIKGEITIVAIEKFPIPTLDLPENYFIVKNIEKLVNEILETKPKIKEYKILLDGAIKNDNFDREIKLKKEIEMFEIRVRECDKEIDAMVYALYGLSVDEIGIVEER